MNDDILLYSLASIAVAALCAVCALVHHVSRIKIDILAARTRHSLMATARQQPHLTNQAAILDHASLNVQRDVDYLERRGIIILDLLPDHRHSDLTNHSLRLLLTDDMSQSDATLFLDEYSALVRADAQSLIRSNFDNDGVYHPFPECAIARNLFCHIDFLGTLCCPVGKPLNNTTANATDFMQRYMLPFRLPSYQGLEQLVYTAFRHGTVHQLRPKTFTARVRGTPSYYVHVVPSFDNTGSTPDGVHYQVTAVLTRSVHDESSGLCAIEIELRIVLDLLAQSLLSAIDLIRKNIEGKDSNALRSFCRGAAAFSEQRAGAGIRTVTKTFEGRIACLERHADTYGRDK